MANIITELEDAALLGNIDKLYEAIDKDPAILEDVDAKSFVTTPLHIAASEGHVHFAIEIMRLKPSFALKLNKQGYSPIHVALRKNHHNLVRRLVDINKDLVRVKGREGNTPLHFVCVSDSEKNIEFLVELLEACPESINEVNMRNETPLHVALKNGYLKAFRVMVIWLKRNTRKGAKLLEESTLNRRDEEGNTVLHISASLGNKQAVELLKGCKMMKKNGKNMDGKTALDLAHAFPKIKRSLKWARAKHGASIRHPNREIIEEKHTNKIYYRIRTAFHRDIREISTENRDAYLVIASLMVTALYQTALSPPGGLYTGDTSGGATSGGADNNNNNTMNATFTLTFLNATADVPGLFSPGESILPPPYFVAFAFSNALIFFYAVLTINFLLPGGVIGRFLCFLSFFFTASYIYALWLIENTASSLFFGFGGLIAFLIETGIFALLFINRLPKLEEI
ncbi:hypothetical protein PIB30_046767 [Stylosanthes scabra]|uniref:PGG domain-containing protein n=1 Tax=Stylosanthes scabra TaxID=79078 RepID=A0ABU6WJZ5_9FABA|nr:hypothetical protein [Stylosanthes scabra]